MTDGKEGSPMPTELFSPLMTAREARLKTPLVAEVSYGETWYDAKK